MGAILSNKRQVRGGKEIAKSFAREVAFGVQRKRRTRWWAHAMLCRHR